MERPPPSIEAYVAGDYPVRVYDAFVEARDFQELGIDINPCKGGHTHTDDLEKIDRQGVRFNANNPVN